MKSLKHVLTIAAVSCLTLSAMAEYKFTKEYEDINDMFNASMANIQNVDSHFRAASLNCRYVKTDGMENNYTGKTRLEKDAQGKWNYVLELTQGKSVIIQKFKKAKDGSLVYTSRAGETRLVVNTESSGLVGKFILNLWGPLLGEYLGHVFICK